MSPCLLTEFWWLLVIYGTSKLLWHFLFSMIHHDTSICEKHKWQMRGVECILIDRSGYVERKTLMNDFTGFHAAWMPLRIQALNEHPLMNPDSGHIIEVAVKKHWTRILRPFIDQILGMCTIFDRHGISKSYLVLINFGLISTCICVTIMYVAPWSPLLGPCTLVLLPR